MKPTSCFLLRESLFEAAVIMRIRLESEFTT